MGKGAKTKGSKKKENIRASSSSSIKPSLPSNLLDTSFSHEKSKPQLTTLLPKYIWVLHDFFSAPECQAWIDYIDSTKLELVQQRGTRYLAQRECYRSQINDTIMAERLFDRLEPFLPLFLPSNDNPKLGQEPITCNPNLRLYKYTKGMSFGLHVDESCIVSGMGETRLTILIYLSTCQGGATRFLKHNVAFEPKMGAMLLHVHGNDCLLHEGQAVESGIKYVLRTDLVYGSKQE